MTKHQPMGCGPAEARLLLELLPIPGATVDATGLHATFTSNWRGKKHLKFPFMADELATLLLYALGPPPIKPQVQQLAVQIHASDPASGSNLPVALQDAADLLGKYESCVPFVDLMIGEIDQARNELSEAIEAAQRRGVIPASQDDNASVAYSYLMYLLRLQEDALNEWRYSVEFEFDIDFPIIANQRPALPFASKPDSQSEDATEPFAAQLGLSNTLAHRNQQQSGRQDVLTTIIHRAWEETARGSGSAVYVLLRRWAQARLSPFLKDAGQDGLEYEDGKSEHSKFLTRDAVRLRVLRMKSRGLTE